MWGSTPAQDGDPRSRLPSTEGFWEVRRCQNRKVTSKHGQRFPSSSVASSETSPSWALESVKTGPYMAKETVRVPRQALKAVTRVLKREAGGRTADPAQTGMTSATLRVALRVCFLTWKMGTETIFTPAPGCYESST